MSYKSRLSDAAFTQMLKAIARDNGRAMKAVAPIALASTMPGIRQRAERARERWNTYCDPAYRIA